MPGELNAEVTAEAILETGYAPALHLATTTNIETRRKSHNMSVDIVRAIADDHA